MSAQAERMLLTGGDFRLDFLAICEQIRAFDFGKRDPLRYFAVRWIDGAGYRYGRRSRPDAAIVLTNALGIVIARDLIIDFFGLNVLYTNWTNGQVSIECHQIDLVVLPQSKSVAVRFAADIIHKTPYTIRSRVKEPDFGWTISLSYSWTTPS